MPVRGEYFGPQRGAYPRQDLTPARRQGSASNGARFPGACRRECRGRGPGRRDRGRASGERDSGWPQCRSQRITTPRADLIRQGQGANHPSRDQIMLPETPKHMFLFCSRATIAPCCPTQPPAPSRPRCRPRALRGCEPNAFVRSPTTPPTMRRRHGCCTDARSAAVSPTILSGWDQPNRQRVVAIRSEPVWFHHLCCEHRDPATRVFEAQCGIEAALISSEPVCRPR